MSFNWNHRKIFNDLVFLEIVNDFFEKDKKVNAILDIGCGNGYLLSKLKDYSSSISIYCLEKQLNSNYKIQYLNLDELGKFREFFDIITLIDVIYLLEEDLLKYILSSIKLSLKKKGIVYILLGIYKESRGTLLFKDELKKLQEQYTIKLYSLDDLFNLFKENFTIFFKRLNFNNVFGIQPFKERNIKDFLDYIYEDKLLIKLLKK